MEEKTYKLMSNTGATAIAVGVITIVFGIAVGIILLVGGGKLLAGKSKLMF